MKTLQTVFTTILLILMFSIIASAQTNGVTVTIIPVPGTGSCAGGYVPTPDGGCVPEAAVNTIAGMFSAMSPFMWPMPGGGSGNWADLQSLLMTLRAVGYVALAESLLLAIIYSFEHTDEYLEWQQACSQAGGSYCMPGGPVY